MGGRRGHRRCSGAQAEPQLRATAPRDAAPRPAAVVRLEPNPLAPLPRIVVHSAAATALQAEAQALQAEAGAGGGGWASGWATGWHVMPLRTSARTASSASTSTSTASATSTTSTSVTTYQPPAPGTYPSCIMCLAEQAAFLDPNNMYMCSPCPGDTSGAVGNRCYIVHRVRLH